MVTRVEALTCRGQQWGVCCLLIINLQKKKKSGAERGAAAVKLLHVAAGVLSVVSAAVCRSGSGRSEDGGEPLAAPVGPAGESDPGDPHCSAGLGGRGVEGGAERPAGDEPGSNRSTLGVRRAVRPWRGGRIGGRGKDLAVPRLPAGGGATAPGVVSRSNWPAGETPDSTVQPTLAEGAPEHPRRSRPLDCGDPCRAVTMTTNTHILTDRRVFQTGDDVWDPERHTGSVSMLTTT